MFEDILDFEKEPEELIPLEEECDEQCNNCPVNEDPLVGGCSGSCSCNLSRDINEELYNV